MYHSKETEAKLSMVIIQYFYLFVIMTSTLLFHFKHCIRLYALYDTTPSAGPIVAFFIEYKWMRIE